MGSSADLEVMYTAHENKMSSTEMHRRGEDDLQRLLRIRSQ